MLSAFPSSNVPTPHRALLPISIFTNRERECVYLCLCSLADEMATNLPLCSHADDGYIDIEVSSISDTSCSTNSPPQAREFEFQMSSSTSNDRESTTSPADELFYKGKLLPLHLPPRLQMVQKLLQSSSDSTFDSSEVLTEEENHGIPFISTTSTSTPPSTGISTPLESCNISPAESCRVSCELNPDEYFFEWSAELRGFMGDHQKKTWSKKLKLINQSSFGRKLKASRAYLKSLFTKSACSDESCAKATSNAEEAAISSKGSKDFPNKYMKITLTHKSPLGQIGKGTYTTLANAIKNSEKENPEENIINSHRRSFSSVLKRHCSPTKGSSSSSSSSSSVASSSSSSFSFNSSNGIYELQFLKRSSSATSEIEDSIEAAIAHCKKSQQLFNSRQTLSETGPGFCSLSASRVASGDDQERPAACSI